MSIFTSFVRQIRHSDRPHLCGYLHHKKSLTPARDTDRQTTTVAPVTACFRVAVPPAFLLYIRVLYCNTGLLPVQSTPGHPCPDRVLCILSFIFRLLYTTSLYITLCIYYSIRITVSFHAIASRQTPTVTYRLYFLCTSAQKSTHRTFGRHL